ncbi:MAG TPA: hypothetical protein VFQ45_18300 [Longimicrobium sp.]|nr:hypothetical protein [Longimicrobium sp.]
MRALVIAAAMLTLAACFGAAGVARPFQSTSRFDGLEQEITVTPLDWPGDDVFRLSSRLVNRGPRPVTVRVVTCTLEPGRDLRTRGTLVQRAVPGCVAAPPVVTLAPGEASASVGFIGQFNRPGRYRVQVRHARDPDRWGEITVVTRRSSR